MQSPVRGDFSVIFSQIEPDLVCDIIILTVDDKSDYPDLQGLSGVKAKGHKKRKALSRLISRLFLNQIPPNLVCDQIILTARGTQAYFFDLGHVTSFRSQLPYMVIGPVSLELKKIMK